MPEGKKILVVDDSITVHKMMKRFLEPEGFEICSFAQNGQQAVEEFQRHNPDLTFMDITMPVMDGITALEHIKKENPGANIVMLSAMGDEEIKGEAEELGASAFLQKPFNKDMLLKTIEKFL